MHILAIALLLFSLSASAQSRAFDVKGVALGATLQEAEKALGKPLSCGETASEFRKHDDISTTFCTYRPPGGLPGQAQDSFAGFNTTIHYWLIDNHVVKIHFSSIPSMKFEETIPVLSSKYGTESISSVGVLKNRMGAQFENKRARWESSRGDVLLYQKYGSNLDYSSLEFYSPEGWRILQQNARAEDARAKGDL